ncbi:MAG: AAA family ATPase [Cyanobacteria bacterium SZAS TMP-1]|nr:AAA family ATPase [Cyanobacteria bacterium SZAS TMP-1]
MLKAKPYLRSIHLKDGYDCESYPFSIPAVANLDNLTFHEDVTFFVGENGSGKSTVLEAIALVMGFSAQGGTKNLDLSDAGGLSGLHEYIKAKKSYEHPKDGYFLRAESFYNVATAMDYYGYLQGYGGRSLHNQSHGESFMATLLHKFKGKGLYLLDEPEAALSPARQLAALVRINDLVEDGSQFIIATHSPILLAYPRAKILIFDSDGLYEVKYEQTEHFAITRDFLNNYQKRLERLFSDELE